MRSERRHHRKRLKKKRLDYYGGWMKTKLAKIGAPRDFCKRVVRKIGVAIDTPKPCSSPGCCGNPRRRGEKTKAEKALDKMVRQNQKWGLYE